MTNQPRLTPRYDYRLVEAVKLLKLFRVWSQHPDGYVAKDLDDQAEDIVAILKAGFRWIDVVTIDGVEWARLERAYGF